MIKSVEEGLEIYKKRVRQQWELISDVEEHDYVLFCLSSRMDGMKEALGISREEEERIGKEVYFELYPDQAKVE